MWRDARYPSIVLGTGKVPQEVQRIRQLVSCSCPYRLFQKFSDGGEGVILAPSCQALERANFGGYVVYDTSDFKDAEVIRKNSMEWIRVFRHSFMGTDLISVRLFTRKGVPLDRGIALQPSQWKQVLPHLEKLLAVEAQDDDIIT